MYVFDDMVEAIALKEIKEWTSPAHRTVCLTICVQNPNVFSAQKVIENAKIINKIPQDRIEKVTPGDLEYLGCYL